jgi:hypothetical protein
MAGVRVTVGTALATVAALVLVCALLAAPTFAEANARSGTVQYADCDRVQSVVRFQYNAGGGGDRQVRQELDMTREQRQVCFGHARKDDVLVGTIVKGPLPDTGGFPALALAGCALVATGAFSALRVIGRR